MRTKAWLLALILACAPALAFAQQIPSLTPGHTSNALEGSHVIATAAGSALDTLCVNTHTAATKWLMIFDGTTLPANGATTSCDTTYATGCLRWCGPLFNAGSLADSTVCLDWTSHPLHNNYGIVAAVSTTLCTTLTVDGNNNSFNWQKQ